MESDCRPKNSEYEPHPGQSTTQVAYETLSRVSSSSAIIDEKNKKNDDQLGNLACKQ